MPAWTGRNGKGVPKRKVTDTPEAIARDYSYFCGSRFHEKISPQYCGITLILREVKNRHKMTKFEMNNMITSKLHEDREMSRMSENDRVAMHCQYNSQNVVNQMVNFLYVLKIAKSCHKMPCLEEILRQAQYDKLSMTKSGYRIRLLINSCNSWQKL